ncbi:PilW family protein [Thiobacillus sp.]|uniref:PilW family protein n=1 Tax=Thiobacillus sp. TaxID=924 RepID=UPI0025F6EE43|nr:PilW family protein [Thiobacillus sp.]
MKHINSAPCLIRQLGMSLIELMVAMTAGLVLLIALAYFFLGSRQINRTHDDVSRMQESGRYALEILGKAIRQAGYRTDADSPFSGVALTGADGAKDTITVQYDPQEGGEADCTGANVAAGTLVTYAFAVNGSRELTCNNVVVADNIEDMQIAYGIDANKDGVIESYQAAGGVASFGQVAAVQVSLLVRGGTSNVAANGSQTFTYNGAPTTRTDGFLRQVYTATYTVRNQAK